MRKRKRVNIFSNKSKTRKAYHIDRKGIHLKSAGRGRNLRTGHGRRKLRRILAGVRPKLQKSHNRHKRGARLRSLNKLMRAVISIFGMAIVVGSIFFAYKYVMKLRNASYDRTIHTDNQLPDVPIYPGAKRMDEPKYDKDTVDQLLALGKHVYELPANVAYDDEVHDFYLNEMPNYGWTLVNDVPIGSDEQEPGLYWTKDSRGLRIVGQVHDLWIEEISEDDAKDGLRTRVLAQQKRDLIMASNNGTDLLPNFPWTLRIPENYTVKYFDTDFEQQGARLYALDSKEYVFIVPFVPLQTPTSPQDARSFIAETLNTLSLERENETTPSDGDTQNDNAPDTANPTDVPYLILPNTLTSLQYLVFSTKPGSPMLDYIQQNIVDKGIKEDE